MPVNGNIPVQRSVLPDGIAGVDSTVRKMVELAHSQYGSKSSRIRALAIDIVRGAGVPDKDYFGEMVAVHNWVRDNIRYVRDPIGQETLSYPEETAFNSRAGDCDDLSILEMALLGSIGIESYPVVVGMFPGHYSHVYVHGKVPAGKGRNAGKIIPLDPIMKDWQAGREAKAIKAKKTYPQLSNPLTMNGLPMGQDIDELSGGLGAYAVGPSYLDQDESHAGMLVVPDQRRSNIHNDKTVANSTRVNMPFEGLDGMLGAPAVDPTGDTFTETSAGDGGTIVQSGGQLVPKGFIRREPDLRQVMAMTPASARDLGPAGPMFERHAVDVHQRLRSEKARSMSSLARDLRGDKTVRQVEVQQVVGTKRYDLPTVQQQLRRGKGLTANPVRNITKKQVVVLNSLPLDRLGAPARPLPSIGEELAGAEEALAGFGSIRNAIVAAQAKRQPVAQAESLEDQRKQVEARIQELEKKILGLRQKLRSLSVKPANDQIRAEAIIAAERKPWQNAQPSTPTARPAWAKPTFYKGQSGLGEGFIDIIKKPIVWGPILAFAGVFALRMYLKKRRAAATV
jgi:hypothetical protein